MAAWPLTLCLLLCLCSGSLAAKSYRHFSSNTEINNVVQDPGTGRVYVGAVNTIYQLDDMLQKQDSRETGPKQDNQACTPPKFIECVTKLTSNSNKLLLVNRANGTLVVCGSLFRGICALLSLENVSKVEYYSDSKGEKTYVVSTEDKVSVVGVLTVVQRHGRNASVFLVGKGYGSSDTPKLITTRLLQESEGGDLFESYDESSVWQASAYTNLFRHIFRLAFQHKDFTYFLFSRTNAKNEMGNYTFISRVCQTDTHYYSYMELQLNCSQDGGQQYSKVQAAFVAFPGERLARSMDASGRYGRVTAEDKVLFVVFGTDSQTDQSQTSALCMYSLKEINERLKEIQDACYSGDGKIDEKQAVYTPYSTISNGIWPKNCEQKTPGDHPCGADFLPSPLASTPDFGISAEAVITYEEHLSAVAVAVENEHTIAFLGTDRGWIYKVHLNGSAEQYEKKTVGNTRVNKNLFFDAGQDHIYITTEKEVTRVPVQECHWRRGCQSCVAARDPYCGWCVAEGKCTRRSACPRAVEDNHWIWSLSQECVQITSYSPENMSRMQPSWPKVSMTLVPFPDITESDQLECDFGGSKSQAVIEPGKSITCSPPEVVNIPQTPESQDFVAVEVKLTFKDSRVELAVGQYRFYDCSAAAKMLTNTPCASCVTSEWRCQWNIKDHKCSENDAETQDVYIIKHAQGKTFKMGTELMGSTEVEIVLKEDQTYEFQGYEFSYDKGQMRDLLFYVKEGSNKIDSDLNVTLYNCSFGREDCSLCKAADPKYGCVWCSHPKSCLYSTTCPREEELCPMPKILDDGAQGGGIRTSDLLVTSPGLQPLDHPATTLWCSSVGYTALEYGERFTSAMTMQEAQAYVGDAECTIEIFQDNSLLCKPPATKPQVLSKRFKREADASMPEFLVKFGAGRWVLGKVKYDSSTNMLPLHIILPVVLIPMVAIIAISVYCYRRQSQQAERDYEKVRHQLENLEESVRDRCKKEFTDLMIEMEDHTSDLNEVGIPFLDYKTYTDRVFFLPSKDGVNDVMITGKLDIPAGREQTVSLALNQFSNLLNSKPFLINFIRTLENQRDFNARAKVYFASLLTVALHGKLEYYTDIMNTLLLQLMDQYVAKNPKLMLRRWVYDVDDDDSGFECSWVYDVDDDDSGFECSWVYDVDDDDSGFECSWDSAGEPLYKLFKAIKHQVEKGPVDGVLKKAKYTLNDTGLLGDDSRFSYQFGQPQCIVNKLSVTCIVRTLQVLVDGEGPDVCAVKVLNCDTISQVKEKIIDQVYRNMPYSQRPKVDRFVLEWRPGSTGQILSDLDLTSQKEGRWKRINTLAHYNVRDNATLVLSKVLHTQQPDELHQDSQEERNALLEDDNKVWHLVRSAEDVDESKSKRGSMKDKGSAKAITEIYLTRLLSVKFVDNFFRSVLCSGAVVPPAVKYFFDFLDEQAAKHDNVDEETVHIWKTNSYYKGIRQMVQVSDQDMNTHLAEVSRAHTDQLNTQVALHQLYQYASKYYDEAHTDQLNTQVALHQLYQYASKYYDEIINSLEEDPATQNKQLTIINSLEEDPATQNKQLTVRLQQIAAALENKVTDL
ncbi:UNVERIFIED_CONTAM: hypothetical protein FKN15_044866 [Acipenser sinensis]